MAEAGDELDELAIMLVAGGFGMFFDDEDQEDDFHRNVLLDLYEKQERPKIPQYFEKVIPRLSLSDFKSHFRMTRTTFEELSLQLGILLDHPQGILPVTKRLAIAIWTFANQEVYRSIAERFDVTMSTAWQCMSDVADALIARVHNYIHWPTGEEAERIEREFREIAGHPGIIGLIDGCHLPISAPTEYPQSYYCYRGYYSINLLAICDSERMFTYIYAACCGSMHDSRVLDVSDFTEQVDQNYDRFFPNNTHILGDTAYGVQTHLLTAYRQDRRLQDWETNYNTVVRATRQVIERSLGLLVGRFRRLTFLYVQNVEYASKMILACCCLHNICISLNDHMDGVEDWEFVQRENGNENENLDDEREVPIAALVKRDIIAHALFDNLER